MLQVYRRRVNLPRPPGSMSRPLAYSAIANTAVAAQGNCSTNRSPFGARNKVRLALLQNRPGVPQLLRGRDVGRRKALDSGELCRAFLAEIRGAPLLQDHRSVYMVPLVAVTDAKDVHDRCSNDLGFGAQKSLVLTLASLRQQLREPDTNEMDPHRKPLCRWRNQRDGLRGSAHRPHAGDLEH